MQRQGLRGQVMGELAGQQGHGRYTPHWLAAFLDGAAAKNTAGADDQMLTARHQGDVGPGVEHKLGACLKMHVLPGLDCHYVAYSGMAAARDLQVIAALDVLSAVACDGEVILGLEHGHAVADHRDLLLTLDV